VLRWSAKEVADVLETSVASVNSALQRARATLDELDLEDGDAPARPSTEDESRLLEQYLEAFAEYDIDRIVALLRYDVVFDMPPLPLWVRGPGEVHDFMLGPGAACAGSKLIALSANGVPTYASYKPDPESGAWLPWSVTLLEMEPGDAATDGASAPRITGVHNFLAPFMPNLFPSFGLPESLDESAPTIAMQ
jgi:RNA polymerase sigma-70 factor, ECF subfamily